MSLGLPLLPPHPDKLAGKHRSGPLVPPRAASTLARGLLYTPACAGTGRGLARAEHSLGAAARDNARYETSSSSPPREDRGPRRALGLQPPRGPAGGLRPGRAGSSLPSAGRHQPRRRCPRPPHRPLPRCSAAKRIQARGCGVWKLFGKCFLDAEMRAGRLCPSECLCQQKEPVPPPPPPQASPAFLSKLGGHWAPSPRPRLG